MVTVQSITLLGRSHAIALPDFAAREELMVALGETQARAGSARLRAYAAALGLCTRLGRESGADYAGHRFDALAYGGAVYSYLREQGATPADVATAAVPLAAILAESTFPRQAEVDTAMGKSEAEGVS